MQKYFDASKHHIQKSGSAEDLMPNVFACMDGGQTKHVHMVCPHSNFAM
jgi:hypothetical protein